MNSGECPGPAPPLLATPTAAPPAVPGAARGGGVRPEPPAQHRIDADHRPPGRAADPAGRTPLLTRHGTLFKFLADLTAAAVALVLALLLLSALSTVSENSLHHLPGNLSRDWLVAVCVMVALSLAGFYRTSRRTLQPNTFSELKDLAFAIGAGGVLALGLSVLGHGAFHTSELPSAQVIVIVLVTVAIAAVVRGISDAELNDVLIPVPVKDGLLLLPSGPIPPNPSGLRSGART